MSVHADKLRWLFWLRWKMFIRGFARKGMARIIGTIFLSMFILVVGGGVAIGSFLGYRFAPRPINTELLFLVLTGVYLLWLVLPLLEFSTNEGLDVSKLALFPLTREELMLSLLFSTVLDIPTVGLVLALGAVVAAWALSLPLALIALIAMLVFYVQLVAISQLILALLRPILHSRRFRDLSIIFIVLLSSSCYLFQFAFRALLNRDLVNTIEHASISPYLQWLPPGMAARAIQQAYIGNWGASILWLAALAAISVLFLFLWQLIVERSVTAADSGGTVNSRRRSSNGQARRARTVRTDEIPLMKRLVPPQMYALIGKDLKYFWRDPQLKATFLQSLISIVFLIVYFGFTFFSNAGSNEEFLSTLGPWAVLVAPMLILLSLYTLTYNVLGLERQSLTTLLLFPIEPKYILWSKNIAVFIVGFVEVTILILLAASTTRAWYFTLPAFVVGLSGIAIILGIGNFTSVFFPQKMRLRRRGLQSVSNTSAEGGCLRSLLSIVAFYLMLLILVPVAAAVFLPVFLHDRWIWWISLPLALAYSGAIYFWITLAVAPRILNRAPEILAVVTKE
jgi:ABC-2 type transport system permease protein